MVRALRIVYAVLAWLFLAALVVQVFFAGLMLFGEPEGLALHVNTGWLLHTAVILLPVAAALGPPEVDRQHLAPILTDDAQPSQDGYDVGVDYGTAEDVANESVFVPDRQYDILTYNETRHRVAVNSRSAPEAEYRYEVTPVASSVEAFADLVREQYLFTLTGLSEAEREVVDKAIDGGYFQHDDAFRSRQLL
jgi:hypothetical protein